MKRIMILAALASALTAQAQLSIEGSESMPCAVPQNMGYTTVYVVRDGASATLRFASSGPGALWERFSNLGAAYAEPVPGVRHDGNVSSVAAGTADMGYRITEADGSVTYFWVVNYANHRFGVTSLAVDPSASDCGSVMLAVTGEAGPINCYGITGRPHVLERDMELFYQTLEYDSSAEDFRQTGVTRSLASAGALVSAPAPLCDTRFTLSPDRFSRQWYPNVGDAVTDSYTAIAVDARTTAVQTETDYDNEQKSEAEGGALGGSAPCEITFRAAVSDAAIYRRWEISSTPDFADIDLSYDQLEFTHTFTDAGTVYVRFTADNAGATCPYEGEAYQISIGESRLQCPNAFSPGASEGVNDEWKVSYRSIVSFDCQIFNRWGKRLATLTHPSQGWDGKVGGKVVPAGVYFYVIKARGSDGKDYNLSGDINVINSRRGNSPSAPVE